MATIRRYVTAIKPIYRTLIGFECERLEQFIDEMRLALRSKYTSFEKFAMQQIEDAPEERRDEIAEWYAEDAHNLAEEYPRLLWQGVFISLYALFEQQMNQICHRIRAIAKQRKKSLRSAAPIGNVIPGEACLRKCGVRLSRSSTEWKQFSRLVAIRNIIAHNHGKLRNGEDSKHVRRHVRRMQNISIDDHGQLILSGEFCLEVAKLIRAILFKTIEKIPEKLLAAKPRTRTRKSVARST